VVKELLDNPHSVSRYTINKENKNRPSPPLHNSVTYRKSKTAQHNIFLHFLLQKLDWCAGCETRYIGGPVYFFLTITKYGINI